ncbi:pilus assembly protein TadB [Saccharopolyspora cebuensis]|uniref:pilus assembly protein TadB n=1 Tax=Saccharopolyspora cebuensis TaxID=418759 RepID=UPI0031EB1E45
MLLAVLLGLAFGAGLAAAFLAALPEAKLHLPAALERTHGGTSPATSAVVTGLTDRAARSTHPWIRLPEADLDVLELSPSRYTTQRLRGAALGAAIGTALGLLGAAADLASGALVPLAALAGAGLGGMLPYFQLRDRAQQRRDSYRRVLAVYLDLVAQERSAGRAATPALREAAEASDHPLLLRIRATVLHAHRLGRTPWDALRDLGTRLKVPELVDVADLADTAADGAAIATSLHTKAASLRHAALSDDTAEANRRSERLTLPVSLLMVAFLGLVLYPTTAQLLTQ